MKRSVIAVVAAAVLAVLGCLAVLVYVKGADARALAGKRAVSVVVATKRIPAGTTGTRIRSGGYVEVVSMPQAAVPVDAMSSVSDSLDKLAVTSDIAPRQLLLRGAFGEPTATTGGLALPQGKIAISFQAAAPAVGFIRPGSKIVVFDTFTTDAGGQIPDGRKIDLAKGNNHTTRVALPRVEVIAVGEKTSSAAQALSNASADAANGDAANGGATASTGLLTLTVAVNQDEAERLVQGIQTGTLYVGLLDETSEIKPGPGVNNNNLFP
jgi:pilus assembly protein CpaB